MNETLRTTPGCCKPWNRPATVESGWSRGGAPPVRRPKAPRPTGAKGTKASPSNLPAPHAVRRPGYVARSVPRRQIRDPSDQELQELRRWVRRTTTSQALALRARIILESATGKSDLEVADELGTTRTTVGKWRRRFLASGCDGLLDEPRPGAPRTIGDDEVERVVVKTLESLPRDATHWSTRSMAKECGLRTRTPSHSSGPRALTKSLNQSRSTAKEFLMRDTSVPRLRVRRMMTSHDDSQRSGRLAVSQRGERGGSRLTRIWAGLYTRPQMGADSIQPSPATDYRLPDYPTARQPAARRRC